MNRSEEKTNRQYVTFRLGEEIFALDVGRVLEVLDMTAITKVPRSSDFMRGVINVRGSVVPVVDLRLKFALPPAEPTVTTRIMVMEIDFEGEKTVTGAVADAVLDVMEIPPESVDPPPRVGNRRGIEFIDGIGRKDDRFILILNMDRVFSTEEMGQVHSAGETGAGLLPESGDSHGTYS